MHTEDEYKQMVIDKTGGLFRLAIGLMQAFSDSQTNEYANQDFSSLLSSLGLYFQIRDDLMNISSSKYMENKSFCEDLTEGKFSFPVIHAVNLHPKDNRILNILKQRTTDVDIKKYAVRLLVEFGSLKYSREVLRKLHSDILTLIDERFGGHEQLKFLLASLDKEIDQDDETLLAYFRSF
jgi:geranylgeranyl diphosphate synthase, type III